jgi:hypothetical protein
MRRFFLCGALALLGCGALYACSSSDTQPAADAGTDAGAPVIDASRDTASGVDAAADAAKDATVDAEAGFDSGSRLCQIGALDAGTTLIRWQGAPPTGIAAPVSVAVVAELDCTIKLWTLQTANAPPAYALYLEKADTTAGSCGEPKGYRTLWAPSYTLPNAFLATHPTDRRLFAVAFDHKNTQSGSSPVQLQMQQIDWVSGDDLHHGGMAVKGSAPGTPPVGSPTALTINGCDLTLEGTGDFPGAAGVDDGSWTAQYPGFLAPQTQPPTLADSASF